jgi:hypothetical protein
MSSESPDAAELERLRAQGRRNAAARHQQIERQAEREATLRSGWERLGRLMWGNYPTALRTAFRYYGTRIVYGGLVIAMTLAMASWVFSHPDTERSPFAIGLMMSFPFWFVGSGLALAPLFRAMIEVQARLEQQWLASLPFETHGYFEVLSRFPKSKMMRLRVVATYRDPERAATEEIVRDLAGLARGPGGELPTVVHDAEQGRTSFVSPFLVVKIVARGAHEQMTLVRRWQHRLLSRVLVPLHRAHPIESVSITRA